MPHADCTRTAAECAALLGQAANVVLGSKGSAYRAAGPGPIGGIGEQIRHVAELFQGFLGGLATGTIDYDARPRDPRIERDPAFAGEVLAGLRAQLEAPGWADGPLRVRMDAADGAFSDSTVARELRFLASHTVHHFAIVRLLLAGTGHPLPPGFGIAPATQRHRAALAAGERPARR